VLDHARLRPGRAKSLAAQKPGVYEGLSVDEKSVDKFEADRSERGAEKDRDAT
jgi:hypothetical protein